MAKKIAKGTRMGIAIGLAGALLMSVAASASAHTMFLRAENYDVEAGHTLTLKLLNGTFDSSLNPITRERMRDVSLARGGHISHPSLSDWYDADNTSFIDIETTSPGTYVAGVSLNQNSITLSAEDFAGYLEHDGILDTLAAFEASGSTAEITELYAKHVRVIFQVGDELSEDYSRALGYPAEILLQDNPYGLADGQSLGFQVLYEGAPVANQLVYASYQGFQSDHDEPAISVRTDAHGMASFVPEAKGVWYISLIHMQKIDHPVADYQSNWATVTFEIR
jgi:uncharacterized GH25 family protein